MPNTIPVPNANNITNYLPGAAQALSKLHAQGAHFYLTLPIVASTADAEVLFVVPTDVRLVVHRAFWEVFTPFTGGASSAIGVSSNTAPHNVKGDILGGAAGDVAAALTAGVKAGTIGTDLASNGLVVLPAGSAVRFDRITSAFTAGAGQVHLECSVLPAS